MQLKSELSSKISEVNQFNPDEQKRSLDVMLPYVTHLIEENIIPQESIANYLRLCKTHGESVKVETVLGHLDAIRKIPERSTMDMMAASMERRNWFNRIYREYGTQAILT